MAYFYQNERVGIFIDGANLYSAARALGFEIDYRRLLQEFAGKGRLIRAFYYTALMENEEYSPLRPLIDWLDYNGYTMVTKPIKEFTDASGRRKVKGNMDIELAIDLMEMAPHLDHVVLFSGDGDFRRLVEAVQRRGVRVSVVSTTKSQPPMVADELRRQADNFIELQELAPRIARDPAAREGNPGRHANNHGQNNHHQGGPAAAAAAAAQHHQQTQHFPPDDDEIDTANYSAPPPGSRPRRNY